MKKSILSFLSLLIIFSMILSGCDININIGTNDNSSGANSGESSADASGNPESSGSSESSSSESGVVSPGKRPFNPEVSEPVQGSSEDRASSYEALIKTLHDTESAFGEAFIGYVEGPMGTGYEEFFEENGYMEDYSFIADIPYERYVETNGNEMYCIVPRDKNSSVSVNEWVSSPRGGSYGKILYKSDSGEPFIITCNEDGNKPNVKITIVDSEGKVFEFSPYFNSQLGWLEVYETPEAHSYDFTVYKNSAMSDILVFEDLLGDWAGFYTTPEGREVQMHFTFYRAAYGEPCVNFWYMEGTTVKEYYEGYAYEQYDENGDFTGSLILELTLTQGTNSAEKGQILLMSTYEFRKAAWDDNWIVISCTGGGNLLEEYGLGWFEMARTMG